MKDLKKVLHDRNTDMTSLATSDYHFKQFPIKCWKVKQHLHCWSLNSFTQASKWTIALGWKEKNLIRNTVCLVVARFLKAQFALWTFHIPNPIPSNKTWKDWCLNHYNYQSDIRVITLYGWTQTGCQGWLIVMLWSPNSWITTFLQCTHLKQKVISRTE